MRTAFFPAGDTAPRGRPVTQLTGTTVPFMRPSTGLREILASTGEQPAELLVLIIEPAVISVQSLAP